MEALGDPDVEKLPWPLASCCVPVEFPASLQNPKSLASLRQVDGWCREGVSGAGAMLPHSFSPAR